MLFKYIYNKKIGISLGYL